MEATIIDWTVTFYSGLADAEVEELAVSASEYGVEDFAFTTNKRVLRAETAREDEAIYWIVEWLAESLFETEIIAQIKEERIYNPVFEGDEEYEPMFEFTPDND